MTVELAHYAIGARPNSGSQTVGVEIEKITVLVPAAVATRLRRLASDRHTKVSPLVRDLIVAELEAAERKPASPD